MAQGSRGRWGIRAWIACPLGLCQVKQETVPASLHPLTPPCHSAHCALQRQTVMEMARELGLLSRSPSPGLPVWALGSASPPPQEEDIQQQPSDTEQSLLARFSGCFEPPTAVGPGVLAMPVGAHQPVGQPVHQAQWPVAGAAGGAAAAPVQLVPAGGMKVSRPAQPRQPSPPNQLAEGTTAAGAVAAQPVLQTPSCAQLMLRLPSQQLAAPQQERKKGQKAQQGQGQERKRKQKQLKQKQVKQKRSREPQEAEGQSPKRARPAVAGDRQQQASVPTPPFQLPPFPGLAAALLDELSRQFSAEQEEQRHQEEQPVEGAAAAWHHEQRRLLIETHEAQMKQVRGGGLAAEAGDGCGMRLCG